MDNRLCILFYNISTGNETQIKYSFGVIYYVKFSIPIYEIALGCKKAQVMNPINKIILWQNIYI